MLFFRKRNASDEEGRSENDDYTIKKSRRTDIIIGILSLICAICIWVFVISSGTVTL